MLIQSGVGFDVNLLLTSAPQARIVSVPDMDFWQGQITLQRIPTIIMSYVHHHGWFVNIFWRPKAIKIVKQPKSTNRLHIFGKGAPIQRCFPAVYLEVLPVYSLLLTGCEVLSFLLTFPKENLSKARSERMAGELGHNVTWTDHRHGSSAAS